MEEGLGSGDRRLIRTKLVFMLPGLLNRKTPHGQARWCASCFGLGMGIGHKAVAATGKALSNVRAGDATLASRELARAMPPSIAVTSPNFSAGGPLPRDATVEGAGTPPDVRWSGVPEGARSLVLFCEDPDAPLPAPFVHWTVYRIPASARELASGAAPGTEGKNSMLTAGFTPAAPPPGHGVHHYHFQLFALDVIPDLQAGASHDAVRQSMNGHILAWGEVVGTFARS